MTDLDKALKCHQHETLRRNYWNHAGRHFRDFWLLNSHLSRKAACTAAHKLTNVGSATGTASVPQGAGVHL